MFSLHSIDFNKWEKLNLQIIESQQRLHQKPAQFYQIFLIIENLFEK
jgi:hypothetical protein